MPDSSPWLSVSNHDRDSAGLTYVYPVVSRRAGGLSLGINLNPNNACNWQCVYCQVPNLQRGGPPPIDLVRLESELDGFLQQVVSGDYLRQHVPPEMRRLADVAFSGNGEPTSAREFAAVVDLVGRVLARHSLDRGLPLRLITNGSLVHQESVQEALRHLAALGGEVWFKIDGASQDDFLRINGSVQTLAAVKQRLCLCAELCRTWVQTCVFCLDGQPTLSRESLGYFELLASAADKLAGVHLYGLARASQQECADRLSPVQEESLSGLARQIAELGLQVRLSR